MIWCIECIKEVSKILLCFAPFSKVLTRLFSVVTVNGKHCLCKVRICCEHFIKLTVKLFCPSGKMFVNLVTLHSSNLGFTYVVKLVFVKKRTRHAHLFKIKFKGAVIGIGVSAAPILKIGCRYSHKIFYNTN